MNKIRPAYTEQDMVVVLKLIETLTNLNISDWGTYNRMYHHTMRILWYDRS